MKAMIIYILAITAFISVFIIKPIKSDFTAINEKIAAIQTIK